MQSRHAAFAVLRTLALRDFVEVPRNVPRLSRPATRPFHRSLPRPFHHCTRHYDDQQPPQTPPQEPLQNAPASTPSAPPKNSRVPKPPIPFDKQAYEMTFTCKPCSTRSTHRISKQGYHFGSVLITCPECKNRHIISDHLGVSCAHKHGPGEARRREVYGRLTSCAQIFTDKAMTIEDLMREKGQLVKKGTLSEDGDLEFWEDGTTTNRAKTDNGK